ncbi:MAG: alginate export family protein [Phycisphaeraceae bacterium]|nr:alginate export family protein [Phycisphaeraceae bacterium]
MNRHATLKVAYLGMAVAMACAAPARSQAPPPPVPPEVSPIPEPPPQKERPLGWLSHPDDKPDDLFDALVSGKFHLNNRFRIELADTTGRDSSTAITNRLRLGYETKPYHGLLAMVEFEHVWSPDKDNYFVPATGSGTPTRTVVADPTGIEVNQLYLRYAGQIRGFRVDLRGGRQRILFDDERFIGNVGWRQFEQTFDAVSLQTDLGVKGLEMTYVYVWHVQRIFGPDGPNWDADSHLFRWSYRFCPELIVTPFVYLLDFRDDSPADSTNTIGLRLSGRSVLDDTERYTLRYEAAYARQRDAGDNPVAYEADFLALEAEIARTDLGGLFLGYQFLGSDAGNAAFRFPLGTNHKFQGFADNFLATPAAGLQNLYAGINAQLPWGIRASAVYHRFWSDEAGNDLGWELDATLTKAITPNWSVMVKGAWFDGDSGQPDTARLWLQTEFRF